ncbi:KEOPS complex subunit Pcc1 [Pyrofollis japonicus]|uniref:KEOPS complex subunit Pcc1 n=1 Tax=Pyrofollis japonicus TaxID=3060460 RepID=UPI00295B938A|nr:KEOPS complex subunit Pcc1 [Pyrofollis japonicus]
MKPLEAEALTRALKTEAANPPDPHRGSVDVERSDGVIEIKIVARDLAAARTLINAYLGLAATTLEAVRAVGGDSHGSKTPPRNRE